MIAEPNTWREESATNRRNADVRAKMRGYLKELGVDAA